jgi:hypothetical protein
MTDLDILKEMLDRAKIEYIFTEEAEFIRGNAEELGQNGANRQLQVERGYAGFVTVFGFDENGMLTGMGAWE